jgi:hypothetical protein
MPPSPTKVTNLPAPAHGRLLGIAGVSLTKARLPKGCEIALKQVRDEFERLMIETKYLENAPFSWITLSLRFGLKNDPGPNFSNVNHKSGDLPLSIEINISQLQGESLETYRQAYRQAAALALVNAAKRYSRPVAAIQAFTSVVEHAV